MQDQVLERIDPELDILDKLLWPFDELLTSHLIRHWRGDVWEDAVRMVGLTTVEEREELRRQVERISIQRAEFILHGPQSAIK